MRVSSVIDLWKAAAPAINSKALPLLQAYDPSISQVHFENGHPKAILEVMRQWSLSTQAMQDKMYPLVALFQDFTEDPPARVGELPTVRLTIIVANTSQAAWDTDERYARNFRPILRPLTAVVIAEVLRVFRMPPATLPPLTERPFWGQEGLYGNTGNIFDGAMDVIEIRNWRLTIPTAPKCLPASFKTF